MQDSTEENDNMPEGTDTLIERSKLDYSAIIFMFFSDFSQISDFLTFRGNIMAY